MSARERIIGRLSQHFGNIPDTLRGRRLLVGIVFFAFLGLCIHGLGQLKMDMTIEGWFEKDDPTLVAFNRYHAQFGSEDGVFIIYQPKDGDVFSHASLEAVRGIRDELINFRLSLEPGTSSPLEHIVKVDTLVNAPVLTAEGDVLYSKALVGSVVPQSAEALDAIRATAQAQQLPLQYFSRDHRFGGIHIETDFGAIPVEPQQVGDDVAVSMELAGDAESVAPIEFKPTDMTDYYHLWGAIRQILDKPEYAQHLTYHAVGNTPAAEEDLRMVEEMSDLYIAAIGLMVLLLWVLFRSAAAVAWSLLVVIFSTVFALGVAGLTGLTVTGFLILTILLMLTVGIADSVHLLAGYSNLRSSDHDHRSALRAAYKRTGVALLLTTLTTMVGIFVLNVTPVVPIRNFAIMSTLGILFAFILTMYVLPVLLDIWPPVSKTAKPNAVRRRLFPDAMALVQAMLARVVPTVEKRPAAFMLPFLLLFVVCLYGTSQVRVDTQILDQYPADSALTKSVGVADEHMMGAYSMVLYLDFEQDFALQDPEVLKAIESLQRTFETKYEKYVVTTSSLVDVVKDANQKLNAGDPDAYRIPDTRDVLAQTLFMFNSANPSERQRLVDDHYRRANIKVGLHNYGSHEYNAVFVQMRGDIDQMMETLRSSYAGAEVSITGIFALAMQAADYITSNQVIAFGIAIVAVSLLMLVVFGSLKLGLIALLPNLIPAFLTLGLLGLMDIPLDFYTMMLAPIVLGISIDDTVHFMSQYQRQLAVDDDVRAALRRTMAESGPGIVFTTLILGIGFGIMAAADAAGTANMGKFGGLAIFMALLNDLLLLPALLLTFKPAFSKTGDEDAIGDDGSVAEGAQ